MQGTTASFEVEFGLTNSAIINLLPRRGRARTQIASWIQVIAASSDGLNFGLLLALAAMGAALIYGTTGLSNFAHGEMVTWGAIVALVVELVLGAARCGSASSSSIIVGGAARPGPRRRPLETPATTRARASCSS